MAGSSDAPGAKRSGAATGNGSTGASTTATKTKSSSRTLLSLRYGSWDARDAKGSRDLAGSHVLSGALRLVLVHAVPLKLSGWA
jgi:hypothetical protein